VTRGDWREINDSCCISQLSREKKIKKGKKIRVRKENVTRMEGRGVEIYETRPLPVVLDVG
jgi:ribosomal protein S17